MSAAVDAMLRAVRGVTSMLAKLRPGAGEDLTELDPAEMLEVDEVPEPLARARSAMAHQDAGRKRGERYAYGLGFGGKDPDAPHPWQWDAKTKTRRLDCSGLLCWTMRRPRQDPITKDWANTDRYEAEAKRQGIPWEQGEPGDGIVYGAGRAIGHCGVKSGPATVIHCSSKLAIAETGDAGFRRHGALVWRRR